MTGSYSSDRDRGQAGITAPDCLAGLTTAAVTAGVIYAMRFRPTVDRTASSIAFYVSTAAGANDNVQVGIMDASGSLIASSTAQAGFLTPLGRKSVPLQAAVSLSMLRTYYGLFLWPTAGGSAPTLTCTNFVTAGAVTLPGTAVPDIESSAMTSQTSLPGTVVLSTSPTFVAYPRLFIA